MKKKAGPSALCWPAVMVVAGWVISGCQMATEAIDPDAPTRVLMREDFLDNRSNWFVGTVPGAYSFEVVNGEYYLRSLNDSGIIASKTVPIPEDGNFDLTAALKLYRTDRDFGYGLCWGGSDRDNRYCFFISADSQFTLFKREGGKIHEYTLWTKTLELNPKENKLEIHKRDQTLQYLINGKKIGIVPYERFFGQEISFAADGNQDFGVESLQILTD